MKGLRILATSFLTTLVAFGCGTTAGGGGQVPPGPTSSGAPAGTPCYPVSYNQGCLKDAKGTFKMQCDEATKAWVEAGQCAAGEVCVEEADPADTSGVKKLAKCKVPAAPTPDTTSGGDADAGGIPQGDGGGTSTKDGGGTTVNDGGGQTTAWLGCAQSKCSSQWAACAAVTACKAGAECVDKCAGSKECDQACVQSAGIGGSALAVLMICADEMECGGGSVKPKCGNGTCEPGESVETCPSDCKTTGP